MANRQRILVAFDGSGSAVRALEYVGDIVAGSANVEVHVAYVVGPLPARLRKAAETSEEQQTEEADRKTARERWIADAREAGRPVLERARQILADAGAAAADVDTRFVEHLSGDNLRRVLFDAATEIGAGTLAVGWESRSRIVEVFYRHVGEDLVDLCEGIAVWVVRGEGDPTVAARSILLALDRTDASMEAVEYVADLIAGGPERIRLFQALTPVAAYRGDYPTESRTGMTTEEVLEAGERRRLERARHDAEGLFEKAGAILADAGVDPTHIETECTDGFLVATDVPEAIAEAARRAGCPTVVVGRNALPWTQELFHHHVGAELLENATDLTVWVAA